MSRAGGAGGALETPEAVAAAFGVSRESRARLETFVALLERWNRKVNLIGPATVPDIWARHVADSLQMMRYTPGDARIILDVGSGGGFPGLVLAIALAERPGVTVHMVESNGKKATFLREAVRVTGTPAIVHARRIEEIGPDALSGNPDVVTARAVAPLAKLLALTGRFIAEGAVGLFLKGQNVDSELTEAARSWNIDAQSHPSVTGSAGTVLVVREVGRVQPD